jgi:DNA-binding response OmpR family regulator
MLTALGEETDRLAGLEIGADDYVTKPFSPREVVLRAQAVLRRSRSAQVPQAAGVLRDGDLLVDLRAHEVTRAGRELVLTAREFDLLAFLLQHPRQAFTRAQLLELVWGWSFGDASTVTVHVRRLREKVEPDPARPVRIVTVPRVGYRLDPVVLAEPAC